MSEAVVSDDKPGKPVNGRQGVSAESRPEAPAAGGGAAETRHLKPMRSGHDGKSAESNRAVSAQRDGVVSSASGRHAGERAVGSRTTVGCTHAIARRSMGTALYSSPPLSGTRAERYTVVVHVSPSTLKQSDEVGRSNLDDGTRLSAETARRLACDCSVVRVTRGEQGEVLNVGRKRRTIPPALRRALEIRDGGCRFPGCGSRFCDCHHIIHWEDGGETCLDNLCLLCRHHHRAVHEEGFSVRMRSDGTLQFYDRVGWPLPDFAPPPELSDDPVEALIRQNRRRGVDPDGWSCSSRYARSADIPWSLEASVWDALDR